LAERIKALSPPERLRFAALLLEEQKPSIALAVVNMVAAELSVVLMRQGGGGHG